MTDDSLLRDRMRARLATMGDQPDYVRLTEEVLGIHNAPEALARRLVAQALVIEDRRSGWRRVGERVVRSAPEAPGVYVLRDAAGRSLYVGKAVNLRRRLGAHFSPRQWRGLKADLARVADAEWRQAGSDLEALLLEAQLIRELNPVVNVQRGAPSVTSRVPARLVQDVLVIVPASEPNSVMLIAARRSGPVLMRATRRDGSELPTDLPIFWTFFAPGSDGPVNPEARLSPILFSWLAGRGRAATRIEAGDVLSLEDLQVRISAALRSPQLFSERIVLRNSLAGALHGRPGWAV